MLWGGRFKEEFDKNALKFSSSLNVDINLILEDIEGSKAHAEMLAHVKIISNDESAKIIKGLETIEHEWQKKIWKPDEDQFEDIHSAIEARLYELIGETAGKLHTGRSRNDQIATDVLLWVRKRCDSTYDKIKALQKTLLTISSLHINTLMPGYTHLQRAQPISLAFHLLAYFEMLERDKNKFKQIKKENNYSPLGSGALAGSTLRLDRDFTSHKLGFSAPTANALDSVSNRDFILDYMHACSIGMMHLSRLCEEIILWSTKEWNFIELSDNYTTGSSLMPQKKNPDLAELIRGKAGRIFGNYISLASTLKSLPLSYNRDLQEDKAPLFDSSFTFETSLEIISQMLNAARFNSDRFASELQGDFSLATDLADWLVLKGIPFREAHHIVGKVVQKLESENRNFKNLTLNELKEINSIFDESALECLDINTSLNRKLTYGSPNPSFVKERIELLFKNLES